MSVETGPVVLFPGPRHDNRSVNSHSLSGIQSPTLDPVGTVKPQDPGNSSASSLEKEGSRARAIRFAVLKGMLEGDSMAVLDSAAAG